VGRQSPSESPRVRTTTNDHVFSVSCLACGAIRVVRKTTAALLDFPACDDCGYVGWREADARDLGRRAASSAGHAHLVVVR
jgi:predicted RNA-binding Zn-ribbon protein involved in translation (DUF1610 family)